MRLCSSSTSIIEDRDLSAHLNILTIRDGICLMSSYGDKWPGDGSMHRYWRNSIPQGRSVLPSLRAELLPRSDPQCYLRLRYGHDWVRRPRRPPARGTTADRPRQSEKRGPRRCERETKTPTHSARTPFAFTRTLSVVRPAALATQAYQSIHPTPGRVRSARRGAAERPPSERERGHEHAGIRCAARDALAHRGMAEHPRTDSGRVPPRASSGRAGEARPRRAPFRLHPLRGAFPVHGFACARPRAIVV